MCGLATPMISGRKKKLGPLVLKNPRIFLFDRALQQIRDIAVIKVVTIVENVATKNL